MATGTGYSTNSAFAVAAPAADPFIGATMLAWSGKVQPAVANQWNLSVQREIANNTTLQVGYVGQSTTHLMVPEWLGARLSATEWHGHVSLDRRPKSGGNRYRRNHHTLRRPSVPMDSAM